MIRAYSVADVRTAESAEMARQPQGALMARAAEAVAHTALARLRTAAGRVVALIGSGDNGGDALYAAAYLARAGHPVTVLLVGRRQHDAGLEDARVGGAVVLEWRGGAPDQAVGAALSGADLVLDGIAGIGGRPGLPEHLRDLPALLADTAYVLAVDLPSGCDPAGLTSAPCLRADETVTFSLAKPVHLLPATQDAVGRLTLVDIGVPEPANPAVERLTEADVARLWPAPHTSDDKYSRGVLGVVAGGERYTGAPVMTVTAGVCAGVGMVRYVGPPAPEQVLRSHVPEAVFGAGRCQAWVIGPGLDVASAAAQQLSVARDILDGPLPVLVDAGGLDLLTTPRDAPTLLTPHAGELERLASRLGLRAAGGVPLARKVADHLQVTVLLKGAVTVVVPPSDAGLPIRSQADAPAWLATAGAGDVLAGVCGALLAAGRSPLDAGSLGALVHGVAAHDANPGGPVRAMDVAHQVGRTVARILREPADPPTPA